MSGHSKWATTKRRKAAQDQKRSALFSKLSRAIYVAVREGGSPEPEHNATLAAAVEKARSYSLPKDKIEAAIAKASGAGEGEAYEEVAYEGYGPGGIALYVTALTDNRNRTAADVRSAFTRANGSLAAAGAVAFQFERKGELTVEKAIESDEERMLAAVVDAGGEDLVDDGDTWTVVSAPADLVAVRDALDAVVPVKGAELVMRPASRTELPLAEARKVVRLIDVLEELDDVQDVYHTLELTDELAAALADE